MGAGGKDIFYTGEALKSSIEVVVTRKKLVAASGARRVLVPAWRDNAKCATIEWEMRQKEAEAEGRVRLFLRLQVDWKR